MKHLIPGKRHRLFGFSLPEVTISVGVAALGITSMLGLLPQSLSTLKRSSDMAAETRINQQIVSTVTQSRWADDKGADLISANYNDKRFYYDDEAVPMDDSSKGSMQAYVAQVSVTTPDLQLPADSESKTTNPYLRRVTVKIANVGNGSFDFDAATAGSYRTYTSLITRAGK